jgi:hypothetical protein
MRRLSWALCVAVCWSGGALQGADEPRALVERAIRALGGRETLARQPALYTRVTGSLGAGGPAPKVTIKGRLYADAGGRSRVEMDIGLADDHHELTSVSDGRRSWRRMDGVVEEPTADEIREQETSAYRDRVLSLLPLLEGGKFTLTALGEETVAGRPAAGVKVSSKGHGDMKLYFDRGTGLVVKYSYMEKEQGDKKEVLHEVLQSDYQEIGTGADEERVLRGAEIDLTGSGLLDYLRKQASDPARMDKIRQLVGRLGDDSFALREKATRELVAMGAVAVPLLQEAAKSQDPEIARRAAHCLRKISGRRRSPALAAAIRLAAIRRPAGTAEVLLALLPAEDADVGREIKAALYALAQEGKPDAALERALTDKEPSRRAAAAAALGKDGGAYLKEPGRRLYGRLPRQAMRVVSYRGGERELDLTTVEIEAFNRFDDRLFARP